MLYLKINLTLNGQEILLPIIGPFASPAEKAGWMVRICSRFVKLKKETRTDLRWETEEINEIQLGPLAKRVSGERGVDVFLNGCVLPALRTARSAALPKKHAAANPART